MSGIEDSINDMDKQNVVELFGVMALFFHERVEQKDVPDGLYRYDLRGSDDDPDLPVSVENKVFINRAATILTARPLKIPEQGFLPLGDELNFTGDEMTVIEFKNKYAIPELLEDQQKTMPAVSSHKAARQEKFPPVYEHSFEAAVDRGETEQFHASHKLNIECAEAISAALAAHYSYDTYCLDTAAASKEVVGKFGFDRTMYVLANTVRHNDWDERLSRANKEWARTLPSFDSKEIGATYLIRSNPGLTDMLVKQVRHDYLLTQPMKAGEVKAEAERIMLQLQNLHEPNGPRGEQFVVRVSPDFLERAKPKHMERLASLLPFSSLKICKSENGRDTCAMIDKSEDRCQPLRTRKPSIKAQLAAAKAAQAEKPVTQQHQKDKGAR